MIKEELEQHHKWISLALEEFDGICKDNGVVYFLIEGSALGAVRHKGIIPWDDDVDIGIFLKDRDKVSILMEKYLSEDFRWVDVRTDETYPRLFGKILHDGLGCIDVFPLIKTSNNSLKKLLQWINRKVLYKLFKAKLGYVHKLEKGKVTRSIKTTMAKLLSQPFKRNTILHMVHYNEIKYEKLEFNYKYVNLYGAYSLVKEEIEPDWVGEGKLTEFCNKQYPVFEKTDKYLTHLYGDYMTPPPETERYLRHEEKF